MQVAQPVDQKLTSMTLSVGLARSFFSSSAPTISTVTGSAWMRAHSCSTPDAFDSHFVVQPNAVVSATGTGRSGEQRVDARCARPAS